MIFIIARFSAASCIIGICSRILIVLETVADYRNLLQNVSARLQLICKVPEWPEFSCTLENDYLLRVQFIKVGQFAGEQ
jgi:hypothetical protein